MKIEVSARQEGQKVKFCFSDNGPGIPLGERRSVFENFHAAASAQKTQTASGLGLGLPTVKTIVEGCLGDICVDAKSGAGACISFTLPIPMAAAAAAAA